jgi:hypothetical protein
MSTATPDRESTKTLAQVLEMITHLGSCYVIAHMLHDHGIKGFRYQSDDSPLSRWIRWETGAARCEIDPQEIGILYAGSDRAVYEYTPELVTDFERRFDRGEFPSLVQTGMRS